MADGSRITGVVSTWVDDRGFGFLRRDDRNGGDVFAHAREFEAAGLPSPVTGERFSFDIEPDPKSGRLRAVRLERT
jgi:cold shock CspA family protein